MAMRKGTCKNFGACGNADARSILEVPESADFICPICKRPLERTDTRTSRIARKPMVAVVVLALLAGGYFIYKYFSHPKCIGILGRPLRVGIVSWPGYAGGIVANNGFKPNTDCIYYQRHNLCVEFLLMEEVAARAKAFKRGGKDGDGVDIVWSTVDFWANELPGLIKDYLPARAIMQVDWSRGGDAIVADRSITRIEQLDGRKISLAKFTPSHWLLEYSLQNSSLDEAKQAQIVNALVGKDASPDARAEFVAGKVDATVVWEPDVTEALKRPNSHIVVSTHEAGKLIADLMVAREDFVREHPDVIEAFVQGWIVDGTVEANRHPEVAAKLLVQNELLYKALGLETTKSSLSTVSLAGLSDNAEMFNLDRKDSQPLFDRIFDQAAKSWVARHYISAPVSSEVAKDDHFLRNIYQRTPVDRPGSGVKRAPEETKTKPAITTVRITVNFAAGSAVLNTAAKQTLDEKVALLPKTFSGAYIRVEGNTDNVGSADVNRAMSLRRAQAVIDYLVTKYSLPREQFVALGNGPDKPVSENEAINNSPEGRANNRRTDVGVIAK
jgi:NitT/TauT family transport system substrate-binding protein